MKYKGAHIMPLIIFLIVTYCNLTFGQYCYEGGKEKAILYSKRKPNKIIFYISGGEVNATDKKESYTAMQYAQYIIQKFEAYDPHHLDVTTFSEESGEKRSTTVTVYIKGIQHDRNGGEFEPGDELYHPNEVVHDIPKFIAESSIGIFEGRKGMAQSHSFRNSSTIVIFISGGRINPLGKPEIYSAARYAQLLVDKFKEYRKDIAAFYEESREDKPTSVEVFFGGNPYNHFNSMPKVSVDQFRYHPYTIAAVIPELLEEFGLIDPVTQQGP